jgi:hypothetical protein
VQHHKKKNCQNARSSPGDGELAAFSPATGQSRTTGCGLFFIDTMSTDHRGLISFSHLSSALGWNQRDSLVSLFYGQAHSYLVRGSPQSLMRGVRSFHHAIVDDLCVRQPDVSDASRRRRDRLVRSRHRKEDNTTNHDHYDPRYRDEYPYSYRHLASRGDRYLGQSRSHGNERQTEH